MDKKIKIIGKNIKRIREQKCITLESLSLSTGVYQFHLESVEAGLISPTPAGLEKIAYALEVSVDELLDTKKKALSEFTTKELLEEVNRRL